MLDALVHKPTELLVKANLVVADGGYRPNITYDSSAPWMATLNKIAGQIAVGALVVLGIALIVGAVMWAYGKLSKSGSAQSVGINIVLVVMAAAAIIGAVGGIIFWATSLKLFG